MLKEIMTKGSKVIIIMECKYPVKNYTPNFEFECPGEFYAKLVADNLQDSFFEAIEKIRKLEYERGWNDAKKRNPKSTYFYGSMTTNKY